MAKWQRNPTGRIAYVNGRYLPHAEAGVHIEDRALQLGDGIYEVTNVIGGKPIDEEPHLDRMERSLRELGIAMPMGRAALKLVMREMIARKTAGRIVNVTSTSGYYGRDRATAYTSAKGGLVNLTRSQAIQLSAHGIRVNAVVPNKIGSPVGKAEFDPTRPVVNLVGRPGSPEDLANAAIFLLSDESAFIVGAELFVDGGCSIIMPGNS